MFETSVGKKMEMLIFSSALQATPYSTDSSNFRRNQTLVCVLFEEENPLFDAVSCIINCQGTQMLSF